VTKNKKWGDLGALLGYRGIPGLSTQIKNSYTRVILPYEHFCDRVRNSPILSTSPNVARDPQLKTHMNIQTVTHPLTSPRERGSPPSSPLTSTSSPLSEPSDDGDYKERSGPRQDSSAAKRSSRVASQEVTRKPVSVCGQSQSNRRYNPATGKSLEPVSRLSPGSVSPQPDDEYKRTLEV
jgi:histone demethylase JARID1